MWTNLNNLMTVGRGPAAWAVWAGGLVVAGVVGVLVIWLVARSLRRTVLGDAGEGGPARQGPPLDAWAEAGLRLGNEGDAADSEPRAGGGAGSPRRGPKAPKRPKGPRGTR